MISLNYIAVRIKEIADHCAGSTHMELMDLHQELKGQASTSDPFQGLSKPYRTQAAASKAAVRAALPTLSSRATKHP
jgi:hypothetical protein